MIAYMALFPNDKIYIGITSSLLKVRVNNHYAFAKKYNKTRIHKALNKYNRNDVYWCVIDTAESWDELCAKEMYYIKEYGSFDTEVGYNGTLGGEGVYTLTNETIFETAKLFDNRESWKNAFPGHISAAHKRGVMQTACAHMGKFRISLSFEEVKAISEKYSTHLDFVAQESRIADYARNMNWTEVLFSGKKRRHGARLYCNSRPYFINGSLYITPAEGAQAVGVTAGTMLSWTRHPHLSEKHGIRFATQEECEAAGHNVSHLNCFKKTAT